VLVILGVFVGFIEASRRPLVNVEGAMVDYGLVGDITGINVTLLESLAHIGVVPLIGPLASDAMGHVFNVNADTVATRLAGTLRASKLFLVSNVPGVLRDRHDASSRIARLTRADAASFIASGAISGGMIPKVQESVAMLDEGIEAIHIVGLEPELALVDEGLAPGSRGTVFVR
jgi:acetylglutamate kinase